MEESEKRFEEELERLEDEPSYMHASWEKFSSNPTGIGAKYLWLKYTLLNQEVPKDVMEKMIEIIKYDIQLYEDPTSTSPQGRTSYGAPGKKEKEKSIYMLLDYAMNNPDDFWEILYAPDSNKMVSIRVSQFDEVLLEKTRLKFPLKRKLNKYELYDFFGKQLGMNEDEAEGTIGERMRYRYGTYKKNQKAEELLFE
jgi:hypothetical protein